jgi:hypothetical protein
MLGMAATDTRADVAHLGVGPKQPRLEPLIEWDYEISGCLDAQA